MEILEIRKRYDIMTATAMTVTAHNTGNGFAHENFC